MNFSFKDEPRKILVIQFKSLGDAVLSIPALQTIRHCEPNVSLHILTPENIAPIFYGQSFLTRVWAMPRTRGQARFKRTWPIIRALRAEQFDCSIDFGGNDRGAIMSLFCGALRRLGVDNDGGFLGRRFCYNQRAAPPPRDRHETQRLISLLAALGFTERGATEIQLKTDSTLDANAADFLPEQTVLCHMGAGKPKKEWPTAHWAALHRMAGAVGIQLAFTTGLTPREQKLSDDLKSLAPDANVLPRLSDLAVFLAVMKRARAVISSDTGPMHLAAGLGVPLIAFFGPTSITQWSPLGQQQQIIKGGACDCVPGCRACASANPCIAAISPEQVFEALQKILGAP